MLVQRLLRAKRDLTLERELDRLDDFDAVVLDDIGFVQQEREEMEVLFTLLAARYERKSVLITSNLVFSQWDRIFKDAMTTAAAIDRLVHHCHIVNIRGNSYRMRQHSELWQTLHTAHEPESSGAGRRRRTPARQEGPTN